MAAFIVAQFVIATMALSQSIAAFAILGLIGVAVLGVFSFYFVWMSSKKLESGLLFMAAHKRGVLILEAKLNHLYSGFYPSITGVPRESVTVRLLDFTRRLLFGAVLGSLAFCVAILGLSLG